MSRSIKISTLDQAEGYINAQNNQIRHLESKLNSTAAEAKREALRIAEERVNIIRGEVEQVENNANRRMNELESDMAEMDKKHRGAMKKQADDFFQGLNQLHDWTANEIGNLSNRVNESFDRQQKQINDVRQNVNRLYEKEANERKKAELMIKDLGILISNIEKETLHNKYAPGELNKLQRRLNDLKNSGDPSAALIAGARSITNDLWDLEEDVFKARLRFEAMHNIILTEATELLETMNKNRNNTCFMDDEGVNLKDDDGKDIKVEVDFWTKGEYGILGQRALSLKETLEIEKNNPELNEEKLRQISTEICEISEQQNELVMLALRRGLASEERVKISEDIIDALLQQGFELKTLTNGDDAHNYLGGEIESDQREGVFAILRNGTGMEISIIIHPDETLTRNQIVFQRNDDSSLNENDLRRSIDEVKGIIEKEGYILGNVASPAGTGDNIQFELADPNALAKVGLKDGIKERLGLKSKQKIKR